MQKRVSGIHLHNNKKWYLHTCNYIAIIMMKYQKYIFCSGTINVVCVCTYVHTVATYVQLKIFEGCYFQGSFL